MTTRLPSHPSWKTWLMACFLFPLLGQQLVAKTGEVVFPGASWERATPQSQGIRPENVEEAVAKIAAFSGPDGTSQTVLVKNGYVIWQGSRADEKQWIYSCTKSFLSLCLGLLWDEGKLTPETLAASIDPAMARDYPTVTLKQMATFTSGYNHEQGDALTPATPRYQPGEAFHYSRESDKLAELLTRVAGEPLYELFMRRIGTPIGIDPKDFQWATVGEVNGMPVNGGSGHRPHGVQITPLALARVGWLLANDGVWKGQRLISQRYLGYATVSQTSPTTPPFQEDGWYVSLPGNYGLNWWTNGPLPDGKVRWPSAPAHTFVAQGNRNNNLFIIPEWQFLLIRLGHDKIVGMALYDQVFALLDPARQ